MFIEYYEQEYQPGKAEKRDKILRFETGVGIIMYYDRIAYHFMILHTVNPQIYTTKQAVPVMQLYRIILDLVECIQATVTSKLIELLQKASIDTFTSLEFGDEPDLQTGFHTMIVNKIKIIQEGIEANRLLEN